jgi:Cft2 family RNA processing exonuclease
MLKGVPANLAHDIEFTNILNRETDFATCNLLRVGDIKIMLDCGCDERIDPLSFGTESLEKVEQVAKDVHFIFLSHPTV